LRVFLDTNVLVSAVATRGLCADLMHAILAAHELVVGETVLAELRRVLTKKIGIPAQMVDELEVFLRSQALVVEDAPPIPGLDIRDASDAAVLGEAVAGEVDVLVTGDAHLLDIAASAPLLILNPRGLWEHLRTTPA